MSSYSMNDMRSMVADVYPGRKWREKVDRMSDGQVLAIFNSFSRSGKFNGEEENDWNPKRNWDNPKPKKKDHRPRVKPEDALPYADQLTFEDF